jgi:CRP/FNR family cyclic AMP-dependent transcriptional regulator
MAGGGRGTEAAVIMSTTLQVQPPARSGSEGPSRFSSSGSPWPTRPSLVRLLEEDPDLGADLEREGLQSALHQLVVPTIVVEPGAWFPTRASTGDRLREILGLLVLDGLLIRSVRFAGIEGSELLGVGDVLRPWAEDQQDASLSYDAGWCVLERTRVAVLDARMGAAIGRWPALGAALLERTVQRSRWLALLLAITQIRRADVRLRMLFWHLADRWGRVGRDGVVLNLALTHRVIAQLASMRRPTVSSTLQSLARSNEIVRRPDGSWLLAGSPPHLTGPGCSDPSRSGVARGA